MNPLNEEPEDILTGRRAEPLVEANRSLPPHDGSPDAARKARCRQVAYAAPILAALVTLSLAILGETVFANRFLRPGTEGLAFAVLIGNGLTATLIATAYVARKYPAPGRRVGVAVVTALFCPCAYLVTLIVGSVFSACLRPIL